MSSLALVAVWVTLGGLFILALANFVAAMCQLWLLLRAGNGTGASPVKD